MLGAGLHTVPTWSCVFLSPVIVPLLATGQCLPATIDMATRQHSSRLHPPSIIHIIVSDVPNIIFET